MGRIVITGGAGFLGSTLAVRLRAAMPDAEVLAFDNLRRRGSELILARLRDAGVPFLHGDVRCREDLGVLPPADVFLECSAEPSVLSGYSHSPDYVIATNLLGAVNCLEYARRCGARVVFFSTSRVYPMDALNSARYVERETRFEWTDEQTLPGVSSRGVSEAFPMEGARSFYGMTKLAGEMLIEEYRRALGLRAVVNRCGVLAGPWQMGRADQGVLAYWVLCHAFGRALRYLGYGGLGKQLRDFLHVEDLADLVLEQLRRFDAFEGGVFNVGGGPERAASLCELTDLCREATGREAPLGADIAERPADVRIYVSDCARLFERTEWRPKRSLRQIVADVAQWVSEHAEDLKSLPD